MPGPDKTCSEKGVGPGNAQKSLRTYSVLRSAEAEKCGEKVEAWAPTREPIYQAQI